jgi:hypothetical protein
MIEDPTINVRKLPTEPGAYFAEYNDEQFDIGFDGDTFVLETRNKINRIVCHKLFLTTSRSKDARILKQILQSARRLFE